MTLYASALVVAWTIAAFALVYSVYSDFRDRIIPDRCVLIVFAAGMAVTLLSRSQVISLSLLLSLLILLSFGFLSRTGILGGGDVKLIATVSLLFSPAQLLPLMTAIVLCGGVLGLIYLSLRERGRYLAIATHRNLTLLRGESIRTAQGEPMPYAAAIASGVLIQFLSELSACGSALSCFS